MPTEVKLFPEEPKSLMCTKVISSIFDNSSATSSTGDQSGIEPEDTSVEPTFVTSYATMSASNTKNGNNNLRKTHVGSAHLTTRNSSTNFGHDGIPLSRNERVSPTPTESSSGMNSIVLSSSPRRTSPAETSHILQQAEPIQTLQQSLKIHHIPSFSLTPSTKRHGILPPLILLPDITSSNKLPLCSEFSRLQTQKYNNICSPKSQSLDLVNIVPTQAQLEDPSSISATPHGIENILNRPLPRITSIESNDTQQQSCSNDQHPLTYEELPHRRISLNTGGLHTMPINSSTFGVYWPSLQAFMDNTTLQTLRDRFPLGN